MHGGSDMASKARQGASATWRLIGWGTAAALLAVPLLAGFPWTLSDYVFAAALVAVVGALLEVTARKSGDPWYRAGVAVAVATAFLTVWINGAVGMIGSEGNPANIAFLVVILLAVAGSIAARFEAEGMARAMYVAASGQLAIATFALIYRLGAGEPPYFPAVPALVAMFAAPWIASGLLFRRAARGRV